MLLEALPLPCPRKIYINSDINSEMAASVYEFIDSVNKSDEELERIYDIYGISAQRKPIEIHLDTPGGCPYTAFGIIDKIETSKTPVKTIACGSVMSAGFLIFISGHHRTAYPKTTLMYHPVSLLMEGGGDVQGLTDNIENAQFLQRKIERFTLAHTKMTPKFLKTLLRKRKDYFFDVPTAIGLGVVDEVQLS